MQKYFTRIKLIEIIWRDGVDSVQGKFPRVRNQQFRLAHHLTNSAREKPAAEHSLLHYEPLGSRRRVTTLKGHHQLGHLFTVRHGRGYQWLEESRTGCASMEARLAIH